MNHQPHTIVLEEQVIFLFHEISRVDSIDTVLHELAHMWFGNLVSPVWWDGLWLNESFATFISHFALR